MVTSKSCIDLCFESTRVHLRRFLFGTIIRDVFCEDEFGDVEGALEELCSPNDSYGWSSAGVYAFWDTTSRELLYIGLASDLPNRFRQHSRSQRGRRVGSKNDDLTRHLSNHDKVGYTIFVQSTVSQPVVSRTRLNRSIALSAYDGDDSVFVDQEQHQIVDIAALEGKLLAAHDDSLGAKPPWNRIGGNQSSRNQPTSFTRGTLDVISGVASSLLVARESLREIADNPTAAANEVFLHAARAQAVIGSHLRGDGLTDADILRELNIIGQDPKYMGEYRYGEIVSSHYLNRVEPFLATR